MKFKITPVEIFILFIVCICVSFYVIPKLTLSYEQKCYGRIQTNAAMITSKILGEVSDNTNKKSLKEVAKSVSEEMNKLVKNPINKNNSAYSIEEQCEGCIVIETNEKAKNITLTAKDKEGKLIVRTVIQPPSFVTFNKDLKNGK